MKFQEKSQESESRPPDDITQARWGTKDPYENGTAELAAGGLMRSMIYRFTQQSEADNVPFMMRRLLFEMALLLVFLSDGVSFCQAAAATPEEAVKSRMESVTSAWGTLDASKIKPFYTPDPDAVIFDLSPLQYHGAQAYIAGSQREFADYQSLTLTIRGDARVHAMTPESAWATATVDLGLVYKSGKKETMPVRWTSIWQKTGGRWIIIHEHWSVPQP